MSNEIGYNSIIDSGWINIDFLNVENPQIYIFSEVLSFTFK